MHSHQQTSGRQSLHVAHWLESAKHADLTTLLNIRVNFQSRARQQRVSQGSSFTDVCVTIEPKVSRMTGNDGDYYQKRISHYTLATETNRVMT